MKVNGSSGVTAAVRASSSARVAPAAALADLVERDRVGGVARGVDDDDRAQRGQALAHGDDLRHLARRPRRRRPTDSELPATHSHSSGELVG